MQCTEQGSVAATFQKKTDLRGMVTMALSGVPEVGSALSGVAKLLWPDDSQDVLFNQMKSYVDQLVPELIAQQKVTTLDTYLDGFHANMRNYLRSANRISKGEQLTALMVTFNTMEAQFFDPSNLLGSRPEQVLAQFIAFGTLKIAARYEMLHHAKEYFGNDVDHRLNLENLQVDVSNYTRAAAGIRQRIMDWRRSKLNKYQYDTPDYLGAGFVSITTHYYVSDDLCGWRKEVEHKGDRDGVVAERWAQVEAAYGADLDALLVPVHQWQNFLIPPPIPPLRHCDARLSNSHLMSTCGSAMRPGTLFDGRFLFGETRLNNTLCNQQLTRTLVERGFRLIRASRSGDMLACSSQSQHRRIVLGRANCRGCGKTFQEYQPSRLIALKSDRPPSVRICNSCR